MGVSPNARRVRNSHKAFESSKLAGSHCSSIYVSNRCSRGPDFFPGGSTVQTRPSLVSSKRNKDERRHLHKAEPSTQTRYPPKTQIQDSTWDLGLGARMYTHTTTRNSSAKEMDNKIAIGL